MSTINKFNINIIQKTDSSIRFDFFIDGVQLSKYLGFDRLSDLAFSSFDLDNIVVDREKFPNYNRKNIIDNKIDEFTGLKVPFNQFGTERIVLYRCHCGCDYCGVISCELSMNGDFVYWKDVRYETEDDDEQEYTKRIEILKFEKENYFQIFKEYKKLYCIDL